MAHDQRVIPVATDDGHAFELIDVGPVGGRVVLFLPGMGISARNLIPLGEALAARGLRLLIHEWRGNGASSLRARRGVDWGYDALLDLDLAASLDAACGTSDEPVTLAGHSLGSQLACLLAARHPADVGRLILVAGGSPYWRCYPTLSGIGLLGMLHLLPTVGRLFGYYPGRRVGFAGREARRLMIDWAGTGRTGRYAWGRPLRNEEPALAALQKPVHVISMEHDWFVPDASADWLLAKLPRCTVTRETVTAADAGTGRVDHFSWMQRPEATAERIAATARGVAPDRRRPPGSGG